MPRNGSGTFVRETPVATGTTAWLNTKNAGDVNITTTDHDFHDQDLALGLTTSIATDGQSVVTANIPFGGFKLTGVAPGTAATDGVNLAQAASYNNIGGLTISQNAGTPLSKIDVQPGVCRDSTNAIGMYLTSIGTIDMLAANGANALDTGAFAINVWYAALVISGASGTAVMATKETAGAAITPTMPTGYTYYRYVGSFLAFSNGGTPNILPFTQVGNWFFWNTGAFLDVATSTLPSATLYALAVPVSVKVIPLIRVVMQTTSVNFYITVTSPDEPSAAASSGVNTAPGYDAHAQAAASGNQNSNGSSPLVITDTSGRVRVSPSAAFTGSQFFSINTRGWIDPHIASVF